MSASCLQSKWETRHVRERLNLYVMFVMSVGDTSMPGLQAMRETRVLV